ncbi:MAG TPA: hypothetical protein VFZ89_18345 [Solirubrobacteraceae bacterium]
MSDQPGFDPNNPPSEEEMAAAYEAQLKQLRVEDVVLQTIVSLLNLGGRKAGLAPGTEDERDVEQVKMAVDAARGLLPLVEDKLGPDGATLRDAISQLQLAYVQLSGGQAPAAGDEPSAGEQPPEQKPEGTGPAQSSGRLWVPGQ